VQGTVERRAILTMMNDAPNPSSPGPWTALGPSDAPAIVFLHGTRLSRAQWQPQMRRLSTRYRCVAVDLPGHGERGGEPWSIEAARAGVIAAIEAEVPSGRAVLVGLSLGGFVAIEVADSAPDRVAGLVLAGCSGEAFGEAFGAIGLPFRASARILEHLPPPVLQLLNVGYFRLRYRRAVAEPIIEGGFWSAGGARAVRSLAGRRFMERLGRLWTPVLIVNGALDPVFAPGGDLWAASCRQGRRVVIRWATHLSNLDQPRAFSGHVARFVDTVAARP
jgi:pimeloyl-ACP methyl ester carboxylesterase